jgi:hypothetical protein
MTFAELLLLRLDIEQQRREIRRGEGRWGEYRRMKRAPRDRCRGIDFGGDLNELCLGILDLSREGNEEEHEGGEATLVRMVARVEQGSPPRFSV